MANIWEQSPSSKYGLHRGSQQDTMLREAEKPFLPGGGYNQDTFPGLFPDFQAEIDYNATPGAKAKQRLQGGVDPAGAATTGSAVNTGSGDPVKLGNPVDLTNATTQADLRGKTTYTSRFDPPITNAPNATVTKLDGSMSWLSDVNAERAARSPGGSTRVGGGDQGPNSFNESNTNPRSPGSGTLSGYAPPDYEAGIAALKDLREAKIEAAGGRGNRGKGMQDYEKGQSYAEDLDDYNSGRVGSEGYRRISNERSSLENSIDDMIRAHKIPRGQRGEFAAAMMGNYAKNQQARLGLDAENQKNELDMNKAAMEGMSENAKLALAQQKELFGQYDADRKFGLDQSRFGLDSNKADVESQYKADQARLGESRLGLDQQDFMRKYFDTQSQAKSREDTTQIARDKNLMDAIKLGQEPGKAIETMAKTEGGMPVYPGAAKIARYRAAGFSDEAIQGIDPDAYAEYMKSQQAGQ